MEPKKELTLSREFTAPVELVFNAWLDPKQVTKWWGSHGVFIPTCELDPKVGGKMYIVMEAGTELGDFKGTQWPMEGKYEVIEKPSKIVFTANAIQNGKVILEHRTTVNFDESDGKTTMTVHIQITNVLPGSEFAIAGMEQGWNSQLDKLVAFVAAR